MSAAGDILFNDSRIQKNGKKTKNKTLHHLSTHTYIHIHTTGLKTSDRTMLVHFFQWTIEVQLILCVCATHCKSLFGLFS